MEEAWAVETGLITVAPQEAEQVCIREEEHLMEVNLESLIAALWREGVMGSVIYDPSTPRLWGWVL